MTSTEVGDVSGWNDIEIDNFGNRLFLNYNALFINCLTEMQIPTITASPSTYLCPGSQITLSSSSGYNYNWYRNNQYVDTLIGQNTQEITAFAPTNSANYTVYVNDQFGCRAQSTPITITTNYPQSQSICMVTSVNNNNLIVWTESGNALNYRIYKQNNLTSEFDFIHEQHRDSLSEFLDLTSDVNTLSASYKIQAIDSCGNESAITGLHKTMLLTSSLGTNNNVNLNWNAYQGFSYPNFEIWRSIDGIDYNLLATVANNTFSYIDNNPNSNSFYQIRITPPSPCTSTRATYGMVSSNIVDKNGNGVNNVIELKIQHFVISPNPSNSKITVTINKNMDNESLAIYSISGQKMLNQKTDNKTSISIDVSSFSKGIYFLEIGNVREKFVVE
jgi:hypothetical protein